MTTAVLVVVEGNSSQVATAVARRVAHHLSWLGFSTKAFKYANCLDALDKSGVGVSDVTSASDAGLESALDWLSSTSDERTDVRNAHEPSPIVAVLECGAVARCTAAAAAQHRAIYESCLARFVDVLLVHYCLDVDVAHVDAPNGTISSPSQTPSPSPARGGRVCACACAKAGAGDCACACAKEKEKEKHLPNGVLAADALEHTLPSVYFEYSTQRVLINRVRGVAQEKVLNLVRRIDWIERTIYLCKHGESEDNVNGKLGGDSSLTERGREFSRALGRHLSEEVIRATSHARKTSKHSQHSRKSSPSAGGGGDGCRLAPPLPLCLRILVSQRYRTQQTASLLGLLFPHAPAPAPANKRGCSGKAQQQTQQQTQQQDGSCTCASACYTGPSVFGALNEVHAGVCEGLTYEEIKHNLPHELTARDLDKFRYSFPMGESYADVNTRLESLLLELEREPLTLIICHQGVGRSILAYYLHKNNNELPYLDMAPHMLYKLRPDQMTGHCAMDRVVFDIPAAKTHRERPASGSAEPVPHELTLKMPSGVPGMSATCEDAVPMRPDASLFSPTIPLTPAFGAAATIIHSSAPADFLVSPTSLPHAAAAAGAAPSQPHTLHRSHPSAPRLDREIAAAAAAASAVAQT